MKIKYENILNLVFKFYDNLEELVVDFMIVLNFLLIFNLLKVL